MIQVRLDDDEMKQFTQIKAVLGRANNASTLRYLIKLAPLVNKQSQAQITKLEGSFNDLEAKSSALLWDSSSLTKNINEIAHAANVALNNDPANEATWNWIVEQLQQIFPTVQQLNQAATDLQNQLRKEDVFNGSS